MKKIKSRSELIYLMKVFSSIIISLNRKNITKILNNKTINKDDFKNVKNKKFLNSILIICKFKNFKKII